MKMRIHAIGVICSITHLLPHKVPNQLTVQLDVRPFKVAGTASIPKLL